jgi:ABC-type polysaccharide/polyol phosphate export permease
MVKLIWQHIEELLRYRSLIGSLVTRELKARYRGSLLGFLWTFLNPLLLLGVYALVFNVYLRIQMEHYAGFMFVGLLPWIWFASALQEGSVSITAGGSLVTKVLFPSQVLPWVKIFSNLLNYLLSLPILFIFLWIMGVFQGWTLLWLPLIIVIHLLFITGLVTMVATINVFFRDIQYILANLLTLWFFLTPILYPLSQVPGPFQKWVLLNPMTLITLAYQDIFFYRRVPNLWYLLSLFILSLLLLGIGIILFESYKDTFAEKI